MLSDVQDDAGADAADEALTRVHLEDVAASGLFRGRADVAVGEAGVVALADDVDVAGLHSTTKAFIVQSPCWARSSVNRGGVDENNVNMVSGGCNRKNAGGVIFFFVGLVQKVT